MTTAGALAAVPARYAMNALLRDVSAIWDEGRTDYWTQGIVDMVERGRVTDAGIEEALARIDPRILLWQSRMEGRRLGRPANIHEIVRMQPVGIRPREGGEDRRIIVLRRDVLSPRDREVDVRTGNLGIAIARHAVERLHEREACLPNQLLERLRRDMRHLARTVAFARAAGLVKGAKGRDPDDRRILPGDATMVPMGKGALVVEAHRIDVTGYTQRRSLVKRPATKLTSGTPDADVTCEAPPMDGLPARGLVEMVGVTYLADDMLRLDQRDYLALFEDAMEAVDCDAIVARCGQVVLPHERREPFPRVEGVSPKLVQLLRENVKRNPRHVVWRGAGDRP